MNQVRKAEGLISGKTIVAEKGRVYLTVTLWESREKMQKFMGTGAHLEAMRSGTKWCDEMVSVGGEFSPQGSDSVEPKLPDLEECEEKLAKFGKFVSLKNANSNHKQKKVGPSKFVNEGKIK